jgi:hypothetical protein
VIERVVLDEVADTVKFAEPAGVPALVGGLLVEPLLQDVDDAASRRAAAVSVSEIRDWMRCWGCSLIRAGAIGVCFGFVLSECWVRDRRNNRHWWASAGPVA